MRDAGGHIIQVLSNTGFMGNVGQSNYGAAKAGMAGLLRCWVLELERYGIRCNGLWPLAETDMTSALVERRRQAAREAGQPVPEAWELGFGAPADVAALIVYLASDLAGHLNGQIITSNGRKIALWTHPREVDITVHDDPWTVEELARHFAPESGREHQALYRLR
jgi:NAD(P)-dependent dehydrogenase (short-subunit alcohol dehydrogenase family)